jgi:hypothetical protein
MTLRFSFVWKQFNIFSDNPVMTILLNKAVDEHVSQIFFSQKSHDVPLYTPSCLSLRRDGSARMAVRSDVTLVVDK